MSEPNMSEISEADFDAELRHLLAMSDAQAEANALSDPDNPPATAEQLAAAKQMPRAKIIRRALRLTRDDFCSRYHIPVQTLLDWEEGRSEPAELERAYLKLIALDPQGVARALAGGRAAAE